MNFVKCNGIVRALCCVCMMALLPTEMNLKSGSAVPFLFTLLNAYVNVVFYK